MNQLISLHFKQSVVQIDDFIQIEWNNYKKR